MGLVFIALGIVAIGVANWAAYRWLSKPTALAVFVLTAVSPLFFFVGFNLWFLARDGLATFADPYFGVLLMMMAAFSIVTAIAAFLGRERGLSDRAIRDENQSNSTMT